MAESRFRNRREAGRLLGERLRPFQAEAPVVIGLPRGGTPVAYEVARALGAPLDVIVVRKLGAPGQPELGIGAVGEGGVRVLHPTLPRSLRITQAELDAMTARESAEVARRVERFRGHRPAVPVAGRTVILVDDGLATGGTARAAARVLAARGARRVILAVPVAPPETVESLSADVDEVVCLQTQEFMLAIGEWYEDFAQTTDEEVAELLALAARDTAPTPPGEAPEKRPSEPSVRGVEVATGPVRLPGRLAVPAGASAVVIFAHGSGSSRLSPRNVSVASALERAGFATLLFDLLTPPEAEDRANVFDVPLLAGRLAAATRWARDDPETRDLPAGYFGASTGAAAALWAASEAGPAVGAVVSRGGRPDLAGARLETVAAPTLLIVGGRDEVVLDLNREARARLRCECALEVVPGATHLFEEPGALESVARLAEEWFARHLGRPAPGAA
ncbi:MAG: dienelactone hydrolase family protein [Acidobacteria bacterium]|nr:dienelactone hydrolase family protein [Acidobacteriota bacterium]